MRANMVAHKLVWICAIGAPTTPSLAADVTEGLDLFTRGWPRAFFFRASEGMASNPRVTYETWERNFERLCGIEGKALDEEIPGRSRRNIEFFTRFKERRPRQLVLLHYNGNARDPRDGTEEYFAGHWVYWTGCKLTRDLPAEEGESDLYVEDVRLFRTNMGRYGDKNEDIGLCLLDEEGRPDWGRSEQVRLVSIDAQRGALRIVRGCFGTRPREFPAGKGHAAAHVTEGPWGKRSNLMWFYNFSTQCPRDEADRRCRDVLVDELAAEFAPEGRLARFDGVEFDVLSHQRWKSAGRGLRGVDTDGDGKHDGGFHEGVNAYGIGVYEFLEQLRERLGEDRFMLADGHGANHQRGFGQLNGIESEGWPTLSDWEFRDWSGGLNRHLYWDTFGREPRFSYINHKWIDGKEGVLPEVSFSRHRLALAAAQFVNAAVCYSFAPPRVRGGLFPVWDELWKGEEQELGWLGEPRGAARRLAKEAPDVLAGAGGAWPDELVARFTGEAVRFSGDAPSLKVAGTDPEASELRFRLPDVPCGGPDLFVSLTMRAAPRPGYPVAMPRLAWVGIARPPGDLIRDHPPPRTGMCLRGEAETQLNPQSGASVRHFRSRTLGDEAQEAYFCHPPWRGGTGYTFWEREVDVPDDAELQFAIGMGPLSPERSDGVVFKVMLRANDGDWEALFEKTYNEFRWQEEQVSLARWAGRRVTLRFLTDCGPKDNSTTDHASWGDVRVAGEGGKAPRTESDRFMTWVGPEEFEATFAFRRIETETIDLEFVIEGAEPIRISRLSAHAAPDAIVREYDHGVVLANPSYHAVTFDLTELFPGRTFRRIRATEAQDREVNSGEALGGTVAVPERDALFVASEGGSPVPVGAVTRPRLSWFSKISRSGDRSYPPAAATTSARWSASRRSWRLRSSPSNFARDSSSMLRPPP